MLSLTLRALHSDLSLRLQPVSDQPANGFRRLGGSCSLRRHSSSRFKQVFADSGLQQAGRIEGACAPMRPSFKCAGQIYLPLID